MTAPRVSHVSSHARVLRRLLEQRAQGSPCGLASAKDSGRYVLFTPGREHSGMLVVEGEWRPLSFHGWGMVTTLFHERYTVLVGIDAPLP